MIEMSMEKWWNEICGKGNTKNPEKNLPTLRFINRETHMEWLRHELGTPEVGAERLTGDAEKHLQGLDRK